MRMVRSSLINILLLASMGAGASPCLAGMLATIGPNWNNFVFESEANQDTPNYYGIGGRGCFGYSFAQVFDLCGYGQYTPGRLNSASSSDTSSILYDYGVEMGARMFNVLYLGVRGGMWNYDLSDRTLPEEIGGTWSGPGGAASFGLLLPVNKEVTWQMSLDIGQAAMTQEAKEPGATTTADTKTRKISHVSVTLSLVYNGLQTTRVEDVLFNSFFKSFF